MPRRYNRPPEVREEHAQTALRLYIRGWTQEEIAEHLGIDVSSVNRDLAAIIDYWKTKPVPDSNVEREKTLATINEVIREHWDAWERSKDAKTVNVEEAGIGAHGPIEKSVERTESRVGDYPALAGVLNCEKLRVEILGLAAATKIQVDQNVTNNFAILFQHVQANGTPEAFESLMLAARQIPELAPAIEQVVTVDTGVIPAAAIKKVKEQFYGVFDDSDPS